MIVRERLLYAFRDPVAVQLLDGISEVLGPLGVGLLLLAGDTGRPPQDQLTRIPLDAVVFATCGLQDEPALEPLRRRGVPMVAIEGPSVEDVPLVDIDHRTGTAELASHLYTLGHRRAATVTLPLRPDGTSGLIEQTRRELGLYRNVGLRLAGVTDVFGQVPAYEASSNAVEQGELAAMALLDGEPARRPTALIAQSDILAAGALRAADRLGLRVPEDLSVAGFDGADLSWLRPVVLSTVVQPTEEKGREAARAVIELLAGRHPPDVLLPLSIRLGTTTGPPPAGIRVPPWPPNLSI